MVAGLMASSPQTTFCCDAIPVCFAHRVTLSRTEVAETLGCSQDFVDSLIADGTLRATKVRGLVFIEACDVWSMLGIGSIAYEPISDEAELLLRRIA
jgi:excisionase family DNA binding protein